MKKIAVLLFVFASFSSFAYRFICNGLLANGESRSDKCAMDCDVDQAARWNNPTIAVSVDDSILPKGLSSTAWQRIVDNSFSAWSGISGSSLRFVRADAKSSREFGANDASHEIFWIKNKQEWRKWVGVGEFGTLGATVPRYDCGQANGLYRSIYDADLVLNGLPHINWQEECDSDDCVQVQTTLVHELGHFFGLDHPCLLCSTSIMSARAGYNLKDPVLDDIEGLRVLYPDGNSGGFLSPCRTNGECKDGQPCIRDGGDRYCSKSCVHEDDCRSGTVCADKQGKNVCAFTGGKQEARKLGENCMRSPCVAPLICAGTAEPNYYCYESCQAGSCRSGQLCLSLDSNASICVNVKSQGEVCDHRELCNDDLYCVFETLHKGRCRAPCQTRGEKCLDGETCKRVDGVEICLPADVDLSLDEHTHGFSPEGGEALTGHGPKNALAGENKLLGCQSHETNLASFLMMIMALWLWWIYAKRFV